MLSPLRCSLRQLALLLGVILALLHGPAELFHERLHTSPVTCLSYEEPGVIASEHECPLCSLATLAGPVPPLALPLTTQPTLLPSVAPCMPLTESPSRARWAKIHCLRAPPCCA